MNLFQVRLLIYLFSEKNQWKFKIKS